MNPFLKYIYYFSFTLYFISCDYSKKDVDMTKINGYWEIVQAQNTYGKNVVYKINTQVDYIEIKDSLGFRKKLKPDLYGNFTTSRDIEKFIARVDEDTLRLHYKTPYGNWTESVLSISDSLMLIKNENNFLYTYKKFKPINITP